MSEAARPGSAPTVDDAGSSTVLTIAVRERPTITAELAALIGGLTNPAARRDYEALFAAVESGEVSGPDLDRLGTFLELCLTTGRIRSRLGLKAEDGVRRVYERTPRGAAQVGSAVEVSKALESLVGGQIEDLQFSLVRPGTYRLVVETSQIRVSVGLGPAGAHVESVEVNL